MTWMRRWKLGRARRLVQLTPPGPPDPARLEAARRAALEAEAAHREVLATGPEVERRAAEATRIKRENNLGPRFWAAVESMTERHV